MKHVVNLSGGACSFWAADRVIAKEGKANMTLLFADTNMEDFDLYRFNADATRYWAHPITWIEDGRTPWEVFRDERFLGNSLVDPCSKHLKRELLWRWIKANCDPADTIVYLGLDWTEGHRVEGVRKARPGWRIEAPMMDEPIWDKNQMLCELGGIGIKQPRLYDMGFPHNNCGGFCIKAGQAHFAHLLRMLPETFAFHEAKEQEIRAMLGRDVSILKRVIKGVPHRLTLRQLREEIEAGKEYDRLDWGGCGCSVEPTAA